jgi:hypothetical protein
MITSGEAGFSSQGSMKIKFIFISEQYDIVLNSRIQHLLSLISVEHKITKPKAAIHDEL